MMPRGEWIRRCKALDEHFLFYGEDVEICHWMWRSGLRCHYDPASTVVHLGARSSDLHGCSPRDTRNYHVWRARYLIPELCYGRVARVCVQAIDLLKAIWGILQLRMRGGGSGRQNTASLLSSCTC
jgi:GT2 family glycosyltransferase